MCLLITDPPRPCQRLCLLQVKAPNIWLAHFKRSEKRVGWVAATEEGDTTVIKKRRAEVCVGGWVGKDSATTSLQHTPVPSTCVSPQTTILPFSVCILQWPSPGKQQQGQTSGANHDHKGSSVLRGDWRFLNWDALFSWWRPISDDYMKSSSILLGRLLILRPFVMKETFRTCNVYSALQNYSDCSNHFTLFYLCYHQKFLCVFLLHCRKL